jgi:hypothetical protein
LRQIEVLYGIGALGVAGFFPFCGCGGWGLNGCRSVSLLVIYRSAYALCLAVAAPPAMDKATAITMAALTAAFSAFLAAGDRLPWRVAQKAFQFATAISFAMVTLPGTRAGALLCFLTTAIRLLQLANLLPGNGTLEERELKGLRNLMPLRVHCIAIGWIFTCISPALLSLACLLPTFAACGSALAAVLYIFRFKYRFSLSCLYSSTYVFHISNHSHFIIHNRAFEIYFGVQIRYQR